MHAGSGWRKGETPQSMLCLARDSQVAVHSVDKHTMTGSREHGCMCGPQGCTLLQESVIMVRDLFRNKETTEFVIATIPTMLGINESSRLLKALRKEDIPCRRIIVNQAGHPLAPLRAGAGLLDGD